MFCRGITRRIFQYGIGKHKEEALKMREEAKIMMEGATNSGPSSQGAEQRQAELQDAKELQAEADGELLSALCMEKLLHGKCATLKACTHAYELARPYFFCFVTCAVSACPQRMAISWA